MSHHDDTHIITTHGNTPNLDPNTAQRLRRARNAQKLRTLITETRPEWTEAANNTSENAYRGLNTNDKTHITKALDTHKKANQKTGTPLDTTSLVEALKTARNTKKTTANEKAGLLQQEQATEILGDKPANFLLQAIHNATYALTVDMHPNTLMENFDALKRCREGLDALIGTIALNAEQLLEAAQNSANNIKYEAEAGIEHARKALGLAEEENHAH